LTVREGFSRVDASERRQKKPEIPGFFIVRS